MLTTDLKIDDCWDRIGVWRSGPEKCPRLNQYDHCRNCPVFSKAARKLLRTRPPEEYRTEWTKIIAAEKKKKPANLKSAFVFRAGNEWLALPAHMVQEVVTMGPIHSIPNINNKTLRGLVNIHGRLQICVSIGRVLGIEKRIRAEDEPGSDFSSTERLVVVRQKNHPVAFPVTEVKGLIRYTQEMVKELPVTLSGSKAVYTTGILHLDGEDIGLLKDKPLFNTLTKDLE
jgi:chemotaxis-related protein WspD